MENWYAMQTIPEKEEEAVELIYRTVPHSLWETCAVLRKKKLFRADGKLILSMEKMFSGYFFIKTDRIRDMEEILKRSREYPRLLGKTNGCTVRIEVKDMEFLRKVCGARLNRPMELSEVETDEEGNLIRIEGILRSYAKSIVRKRLRKRYVLAQVDLFGRQETIQFGICLPGDEIWERKTQRKEFLRQ